MLLRRLGSVVLVAGTVSASACALVLGDFDDKGSSATGTGGATSSSSSAGNVTSASSTSGSSTSASSSTASSTSTSSGTCTGLECGSFCVDPMSDDNDCGACGVVCLGGSTCLGGKCTCPVTSETYCAASGKCVQTSSDAANCGACGKGCADGMECLGGKCGPNGALCSSDSGCVSGHCVGAICCATACTDEGAATCGNNGTCLADGSACAKYPAGTKCGTATCTGSMLTPQGTCNGSGTCGLAIQMSCPDNFACDMSGHACKTLCNVASDCASSKYECGTIQATMGQCLLKPGQPCSAGDQCASDGCSGMTGCL